MGETCCLVFTSVVVLAGAIMAVLIGMVLPPYLTTHGYARTVKECDCEPCELPSVECLYKVRLPRLTPRYRAKYKISSYNYLASLSVPLYIDTPHLKVFACNGIIISEQFILTGRGCIDNLDDFDHVTVRCGSEHWNKGGNIHSILFVYQSPINDIYVAKVSPPFTFNGTCGKAVLKPPEESKKNQEDSKEKPPEESKEKPSEESKEKPPEVPKEKTPEGPKEKTPEGSKEKTPEGSKENPPEESKKQPPEVSKKGGNKTKREAIKSTTYYSPGWHKSGLVLNHNMSGRIIHSNQSLVLQKVTRQSAGKYRCSVVNSEGETVSDELNFRVQYAPTCKYEKIIVVGASRGESVDIVCEIESDPPAKSYRWKFNNSGETLDVAAERFAKTSNGTVSVLRYTPVSELDYGSLSCWAVNAVGHQINPCVFQVVAAGKPFPVKNCSLSNQTSNSVEVFCLPGFDGGLPQHFLLELYSANSALPRYNMTSYIEPYFFLDNLEPDITFRIVIFAVNSKGRSHGVVLEEVTFKDAEKRTASDGDLPFSPILGVLIGASLTIIIVITLIVLKARRAQNQPVGSIEQKVTGGAQHNTMSSTKPLLRSASPRDADERDPDVIPAKYDSPADVDDNNIEALNGPQAVPIGKLATSPSYAQSNVPAPQWVSPLNMDSSLEQYHQYNNPVAMVGTFPRDSRPKELRLGNGNSSTLQRATDLELNGLAIKERLMANRLPESCV